MKKIKELSVSICVHPWLRFEFFTVSHSGGSEEHAKINRIATCEKSNSRHPEDAGNTRVPC
jgi:hypothetical protein